MKFKWLFERLRSKSLFFSVFYVLQVPFATFALLSSKKIHPAYDLSFVKKMRLGLRMFLNTLRIETGSTYKAHLVMALKLFELPPPSEVPGDVVECGTWKGGSAANLSIVCKIVGRQSCCFGNSESRAGTLRRWLPTGLHSRYGFSLNESLVGDGLVVSALKHPF